MLYPIKFRPRLKERIWGGSKLTAAGKRAKQSQNKERIGESWEISGRYTGVFCTVFGILL